MSALANENVGREWVFHFRGYIQLRMATDPDPTDEPRGLSGYTFALPGEPDFDQLLHWQPDEPGVYERDFGDDPFQPRVGVTIVEAYRAGVRRPEVEGARVTLVNSSLVELNGLLVRNDYFAIDPVQLRITRGSEVLLERVDVLDPSRPNLTLAEAGSPELLRRQPRRWQSNSEVVARATGLPSANNEDLIANRIRRRAALTRLREQTCDAERRAALDTRIAELNDLHKWWALSEYKDDVPPIDRRAYTLALQADGWDIDINGPVACDRLGGDASRPWPFRFWLGGWDSDALCLYTMGKLCVPLGE